MVDFTLTDEQKDLRELAHNFAEKEIRKVAPGATGDAPVQRILRVSIPEKSKKTQMIAGTSADAAKALVAKLRDEARVL